MADEQQIGQDEIEELLRQSQGAADAAPAPPPAAPAAGGAGLDQSDLDALISGAGGGDDGGGAAGGAAAPQATTAAPPAPPAETTAAAAEPGDDIHFLLAQAEAALASVDSPNQSLPEGIGSFELSDFAGTPANADKATLELLRDVELNLRIELGRTHMYLEDVLKLKRGSVVPLDKLAGDPVDVFVNGRLVARGEILVLNDNFCVRVAELLSGDERE
ncbi:MAG: flagellar motor switch protein FliN [Pirellulaceae bacterium]|jgi:flagellar motor switch protein FliN/FliY|nr:flagellar motor switch protein FliN [Pirellulaceae bacterium]MDP7016066.1 flagellar motor switch protein FliN [Pirellulaceae bacterium]